MKERIILHSDLNNFFASVEIALNPELKGKPVAVCGDPKARHGIVLAKNEQAKKYGIKTAETVFSALRKCPNLVCVPPHHTEYKKYSRRVREIYERFTDCVEECSIDECALDVTASTKLFGSGEEIAQKIRQAVKDELGVTVSVGVSFNKVFAKLASELKKPDAVTVIPKDSFEKIVYPLPVGAMVSIGGATEDILQKYGIFTLGDLAHADEDFLSKVLGKHGRQVSIYARGLDDTPVRPNAEQEDVKSIGNSTTLPINITDRDEIKRWFYVLAESVTARQRDADVGRANTVHVVVRHPDLSFKSFQTKVQPTSLCGDVAKAAFELFCKHCPAGTPVRLLGITISGFDNGVEQLLIGDLADEKSYHKRERAEDAVSKIRKKYGYATLQRGVVMQDERLNGLDFRHDKQEPPKRGKLRRDEKKD